jgi:hypothetical protein
MAKKASIPPDELISTAQAAAELGISVPRMLVLINTGRLPAKRIGSFWTVRFGDLVRDRPPGRPRSTTPAEPGTSQPGAKKKQTKRKKKQDS